MNNYGWNAYAFLHSLLIINFKIMHCIILSVVGLSGLEPPTSRLSGVRSNRLSYKPIKKGLNLQK